MLKVKLGLYVAWVKKAEPYVLLTSKSKDLATCLQSYERCSEIDKCFLLKDVAAGKSSLWTGNSDSALKALHLDLWVEWSRFMIYSLGKMLVYGSDLWAALNEKLLAENGNAIFGCQVSIWYQGRGFVCNEPLLCGEKCIGYTFIARLQHFLSQLF